MLTGADTLAIRADGGAGIGAGHVMRCVALADAWQRGGGRVEWFCRPLPPMLTGLIASRGFPLHEIAAGWSPLDAWAHAHRGSWICVDGYHLQDGPARLKAAGARVLVLADDARWGRYECDAILNQVIGAEHINYDVPQGTVQMLGTRFCLLRREFVERLPQSARVRVAGIFISFGGDDAQRLSERIGPLLAKHFPDLRIDVAAGVMSDRARIEGPTLALHHGTDLGGVMQQADLAVVAAGSVCWELAYFGVPAVTMVVADNQEAIARGVDDAGIARSLGWFDRVSDAQVIDAVRQLCDDHETRRVMSARGQQLVDGRGGDRVVTALMGAA
jgi:UDP-2,4-diacetamido-2,4,6-trideoxy-beta-L-altropyranose hydrolase